MQIIKSKQITKVEEVEEEFEKSLSKFSCLMIGIGGLIGGGIFSVIGTISKYTGPYTYLSYIITGIVALFTVYSYSKLNKVWFGPGGEYMIVGSAFKDSRFKSLGSFSGLLLYFGYITTIALYGYTFSVHFLHLFNIEPNFIFIALFIIFIISGLILVNLRNVEDSSKFEDVIVILYIGILVVFIVIGIMYSLLIPDQMIINVGLDGTSLSSFNFSGIILGSAMILVSYEGFQLIAYETKEMKNKEDGLKMMKWTVVIAMTVYFLVGFTATTLLGNVELTGVNIELSIVIAASRVSAILFYITIFGALLATTGAINATLLGSSRLLYMISKNKVLPESFSKINKAKVPYIAVIITGVLSILLALVTGGALAIAGVAGLIFSQIFFIMNYTNFKKRKTTQSNGIISIIGMILTASFFIILFSHSIINIDTEYICLITFILIECIIFSFVVLEHKR